MSFIPDPWLSMIEVAWLSFDWPSYRERLENMDCEE